MEIRRGTGLALNSEPTRIPLTQCENGFSRVHNHPISNDLTSSFVQAEDAVNPAQSREVASSLFKRY